MMIVDLEPQKRAYHIIIDYVEVDHHQHCPMYDVIIAAKNLDFVLVENLMCDEDGEEGLPPEEIEITESIFKLEETYSFSEELIRENLQGNGDVF